MLDALHRKSGDPDQKNMILAALLLLFVIVAGPTTAIFTGFFDNLAALESAVGRRLR